MAAPCILVVEGNEDDRAVISEWFEGAGYDDVMFCPGPGGPDYTCIGSNGAPCPLSTAADIVVVDLRLRSDEMLAGTPAWQLLLSYYEQGKRIVAISSEVNSVRPAPDEQLHIVHRPLERDRFLSAVNSFPPLGTHGGMHEQPAPPQRFSTQQKEQERVN
jgi:CheY-like chemotaxis protein